MTKNSYSIRQARAILRSIYLLYKSKWKNLSFLNLSLVEEDLGKLDQALLAKDQETADTLARKLETFASTYFRKTPFDHLREIFFAMLGALLIAIVVKQMWFEIMVIPTGSMRPTFKEQDHLIVNKDCFGLNIPLLAKQFFFDPSTVERTGTFIFRPENMDIKDTDTSYFGIPAKKRFIKRCMGKPGDTLYFYGGKIYGFDRDGKDLLTLREAPWIENLEHVPFINFDGRVDTSSWDSNGYFNPVYYKQMNQTIAKQSVFLNKKVQGEVMDGEQWTDESSSLAYADFWGMKNYGMVRLMSKNELYAYSSAELKNLPESDMYLEIRHSPHLSRGQMNVDSYNRIRPLLSIHTSILPLGKKQLERIMENMYTMRFDVEDGTAKRYSINASPIRKKSFLPKFSGVENGRYEFYNGIASEISWGGKASPLSEDHLLYQKSQENIQKLFNLGIEMLNPFAPYTKGQQLFPSRFTYFRNGDLYLMGAPIVFKDEANLLAFHDREKLLHSENRMHQPFYDHGPPLNDDGTLDIARIETYGLKIPEGMYLALGDNHAASGDSRDFGFVPEENIRGTAGLVLWPPGERWGYSAQGITPWITVPRVLIFMTLLLSFSGYFFLETYRKKRPLFKKLS
ncbi:MAG: signal peptidase I [Chlamydiales bacterium]|jgi:signal peptidase I